MATGDGIRPGLEGRLERVVEGELITRHVGGAGTFSTPAMIGLMEITSHRAVERLLADGETTVGYEVHVRHLGNKLYFEVECRQGDRVIGSGMHKRAIVPANY